MNACFLRLNSNTKVILQQSQNKGDLSDMKSSSFIKEDKDFNLMSLEEEARDIFVSSIGESGSNELKFYNTNDFTLVQRLELS